MRPVPKSLTRRSDASVTVVGSLPLLCISIKNSFRLRSVGVSKREVHPPNIRRHAPSLLDIVCHSDSRLPNKRGSQQKSLLRNTAGIAERNPRLNSTRYAVKYVSGAVIWSLRSISVRPYRICVRGVKFGPRCESQCQCSLPRHNSTHATFAPPLPMLIFF